MDTRDDVVLLRTSCDGDEVDVDDVVAVDEDTIESRSAPISSGCDLSCKEVIDIEKMKMA